MKKTLAWLCLLFILASILCSTSCKQPSNGIEETTTNDINVCTGDYVLKNKTYVRKAYYSELTPEEKSQIFGVVCVTDSGTPVILGVDFPETELMWTTAPTGMDIYFTDISVGVNGNQSSGYTFSGDLNGSDNWSYICSTDPVGTKNEYSTYPVFYFANMYGSVAGLTGTDFEKGWYVPSISELYEAIKRINVIEDSLNQMGIKLPYTYTDGLGITNTSFWSSSQTTVFDKTTYKIDYETGKIENVARINPNYVWAFHNFDSKKIKPYDNYGTPEITSVTVETVGKNYTGTIPVTIIGNDLLSGTITSDNPTFGNVKYKSNTEATATIGNPGVVGEHNLTVSCGKSIYHGSYNVTLVDDYFKIVTIGGEDSAYKVAYPDRSEYNDSFYESPLLSDDFNNYSGNYKSYIDSLIFSNAFKEKYASIFNGDKIDITWYEFIENDDYISGNQNQIKVQQNFDYLISLLNTVCSPVFEDIAKSLITCFDFVTSDFSGTSISISKGRLYFYHLYRMMCYQAYNYTYLGYSYSNSKWEDYDSKIDDYISTWERVHENYGMISPITDIATDIENGCPQIIAQMNLLLVTVAENMQVEVSDLQKIINFSLIMDSLKAIHDMSTFSGSGHGPAVCHSNEILEVI